MSTFLPTLIFTLAVFAFFALALGVKMLFDKKAEFKGGCASNNPMLRNEIGECTVCGRVPEKDCDTEEIKLDKLPKIG